MSSPPDIGGNVRRRRQALGWTLETLADASGVSAAMLSEVERALKNPTVKLTYEIARALGCSLTDLLEDTRPSAAIVVRAAARRSLIDPETGVARHTLSPEMLRRGLELVSYELPPRVSAGPMVANRAGILEHVTVVRGTLTLRLGEDTHVLRAGDGVTYTPDVTVEYVNDAARVCEFVLLADTGQARTGRA